MSEEVPVLTEVRGPILIITLNRPEAKNAANLALSKGVAAALDRLDSEDAITVGIITGAGGTFCSGMDLKGLLKGERPSIPGSAGSGDCGDARMSGITIGFGIWSACSGLSCGRSDD